MITNLSEKSFCNCKALTEVQCDNVKEIETSAFYNCSSFKNGRFNKLEHVGNQSFAKCTSLSLLQTSDSNANFRLLDQENFIDSYGVVLLDKNNGTIQWGSIPNCHEVFNVPNYVSSINSHAFEGCINLQSFGASTISSIGEKAFSGCIGLSIVDFGQLLENVPQIADNAFDGCQNVSCFIPKEISSEWNDSPTWKAMSESSKIKLIPHDPCMYVGVRDEFGNVTQHRISLVRGLLHLSGNYLVDDEGNVISYEDITYLEGYDCLCVWFDDNVFDNSDYFNHISWGGYSGLGGGCYNYDGWSGGLYWGNGCWSHNFEYIDYGWTKPSPPNSITLPVSVIVKIESTWEEYVGVDPDWSGILTPGGHWEVIWMPKAEMPYVYFQALSATTPEYNHRTEHKILTNEMTGVYLENEQLGTQTCLYGDTVKNKDITYVLGGYKCKCKSFSNDAFRDCDSLTCVNISSVNSMGTHVFDNCDTLKYALMPVLNAVPDYSFNDCGKLRLIEMQKIQSVGAYSFNNCSSLYFMDIPEAKAMGEGALNGCSNLGYLNSGNLTSISQTTLKDCSALASMDCWNILSIGSKAFKDHELLSYVRLSNSNTIDEASFSNCPILSSLSVSETNQNIRFINEDNVISNCGNVLLNVGKNTAVWCAVSRENGFVALSSNINRIGEDCFKGCTNINSVDCYAVSSIGENAFNGCQSLSSLYFGNVVENVAAISENSIDNCTYPISVFVPYQKYDHWQSTSPWDSFITNGKICLYQTVTITLILDGGTCNNSYLYVTKGQSVGILPTAKKQNYVFVGWFTSSTSEGIQIRETDTFDVDTTIYARYVIAKVTMTPIGNITIDSNGIASGFSRTSYLKSNEEINFADNIKFVVRCKTGSDTSSNQGLFGMNVANTNLEFGAYRNKFMWEIATGTVDVGTHTCSPNTEYWYKVTKDETNTYRCYFSSTTDSDDAYVLDYGPYSREQLTIGQMLFGFDIDVATEYWRGTIDLKNSYMEINGDKITFIS